MSLPDPPTEGVIMVLCGQRQTSGTGGWRGTSQVGGRLDFGDSQSVLGSLFFVMGFIFPSFFLTFWLMETDGYFPFASKRVLCIWWILISFTAPQFTSPVFSPAHPSLPSAQPFSACCIHYGNLDVCLGGNTIDQTMPNNYQRRGLGREVVLVGGRQLWRFILFFSPDIF